MHILRDPQRRSLAHSLSVQHSAEFLDMRLGKTLVAIRRVKLGRVNLILVVAPNSALAGWQDQLEEDGEKNVVMLTETALERKVALARIKRREYSGRLWCLVNKEGHRVIPEMWQLGFQAVILDESPFIKNPNAEVTKYFLRNFRGAMLRMILSGTPAPESELDYFCQLQFLDPNILPFNNYYEYRFAWFTRPPDHPDSNQWFITVAGRARLAERLAKYCFFLKRSDVNMGGEKIYETRKLKLSPKALKAYRTVEREFILEMDGKVIDKTIWATQKHIWCRRICGGILNDIWDGKLKELVSLLNGELKNEQVVVWAVYHEELKTILDTLNEAGIPAGLIHGKIVREARERQRKQFIAGKLRALVCQPEAFKYGTDMGTADTMIYYSSPEGLLTREQTEDRIIRVHEEGSKLIIDLVVEKSVETSILRSLKRKEGRIEMMRRIVEEACARNVR